MTTGPGTVDPPEHPLHATDITRPHQVGMLTAGELERARRELRASLALARPESPARVPILARLRAVEAELARRDAS